MRKTHKKLGQLIKAYAGYMDDEETFSFEAFGKPREAMVTIADDLGWRNTNLHSVGSQELHTGVRSTEFNQDDC